MVDPARLASVLERMRSEIDALRRQARRDDEAFSGDENALPAVKYRFVIAIEAAIDAAQHVIASGGLRLPTSFADAFAVLAEEGLMAQELADEMGDAARFRNLLVHGYADVDDERVVELLRTRLDELEAAATALAAADIDESAAAGEE